MKYVDNDGDTVFTQGKLECIHKGYSYFLYYNEMFVEEFYSLDKLRLFVAGYWAIKEKEKIKYGRSIFEIFEKQSKKTDRILTKYTDKMIREYKI